MGEVYRATDTILKRQVAIKILPASFAADEQRLSRFQREAELLASLNHPNIAHLYGFDASSDVKALVMELVEGPTLADRLERGAIPCDEAIKIARQIGDALEAAHERGVIHRDLKPANVKVREDGTVKVLDFGLAKLADGRAEGGAQAQLTQSPTITSPAMTQAGIILGTAAYMSPEQARGRAVDKRTDIWAFGCVLYEMLTGTRLFQGEDVSETLASVMKDEPSWDAVPVRTRRLLTKCLHRDPKQRLRDIGDAWSLLDDVSVGPDRVVVAATPRWQRALPWALAAVATLALVAVSTVHWSERPAAVRATQFQLNAAEGSTILSLAISPDGAHIAYAARTPAGRYALWVRDLDSLDVHELQTSVTSGTAGFFWSPNSRFIAYVQPGKLSRIAIAGGPPEPICDLPFAFRGGAWNADGTILFGMVNSGVMKVSESGGMPVPVTTLDAARTELFHGAPSFLPDGRHFIYYRSSPQPDATGYFLGSLDVAPEQQSRARLIASDVGAVYANAAPDARAGHIIFSREGSLLTQTFDPVTLTLSGDPVLITATGVSFGVQGISASKTGTLTYFNGDVGSLGGELAWFDRKGTRLPGLERTGHYNNVQLSTDGKVIVVNTNTGTSGGRVWTGDAQRGVFTLLNPGEDTEASPAVSPDGRRIAFTRTLAGAGDLFLTRTDGAHKPEEWVKSSWLKHPNDISSDGRFLVYDEHDRARRQDLWIVALDGDHKPIPFLNTNADETFGQFSPDDKWLAYSSDESTQREVYVQRVDPTRTPAAGGNKLRISVAGGDKPRWRRDGKELYYLALDGTLMAVPITWSTTIQPGTPTPLFQTHTVGFLPYAVSPDGRFLINTTADAASESAPITVILNWEATLKR
jgi:Tol biopolymer transport system component